MTSHQEAERTAAPHPGGEDESWGCAAGASSGDLIPAHKYPKRGHKADTAGLLSAPALGETRSTAAPSARQAALPCCAVPEPRHRLPGGCGVSSLQLRPALGSSAGAALWQRPRGAPDLSRAATAATQPSAAPACRCSGPPPPACVSLTHARLRSPSLRVPSTPRAHRVPAASRPAVLRRPTEAIILLRPLVRHRALRAELEPRWPGRAFTFFISGRVGGNPISVFGLLVFVLGLFGFCLVGFFFFLRCSYL